MVKLKAMSSSGRKKAVAVLAVAAVFILAAAALLLSANRIIKARLEAALGNNFSVERISAGLGGIDAYGIQLRSGEAVVLRADKISLRASLLGVIKKQYIVSSLTVENPLIDLTVDKKGFLVNPFGPSGNGGAGGGGTPPFSIHRIRIEGGMLRLRDERLPAPYQMVELRNRRISFDAFSYPFADGDSAVSVDAAVQGKLVAGEIKADGTVNLKTLRLKLTALVERLRLFDEGGRGPALKAEKIAFAVASTKESPRHYAIAELAVERPFARLEIDRSGDIVNPLALLAGDAARHEGRPKGNGNGTGSRSGNGGSNGAGGRNAVRLVVKKIALTGGELLYLDHKISRPPHATRLTSIAWHINDIAFPFDSRWTSYTFSALIPGSAKIPGTPAGPGSGQGNGGALQPAELKWQGKTVLSTFDTDAKVTLSGLDLTGFRPYYQKKGDAEVTRGTLGMTIALTVRDKVINGPGRAVLKDLAFDSGKGLGGRFLGAPRALVIKLLKSGNNEIGLDFTIEGNLSDPKFSITERLVTRLTLGLAKGLGLTVVDAGKSVVELGVKGVGQVGKGILGIGKGVQGIFKKEKR